MFEKYLKGKEGVWKMSGRGLKCVWKVYESCPDGLEGVVNVSKNFWMVTGRCLEGVLKVSRWFWEGVWKVSGRCLDGVWKVSGWCIDHVWEVSARHL